MKKLLDVGVVVCLGLSFFVCKFYIVMSGSMEPVVHTGALAIIEKGNVKAGLSDIILYQLDNICVLHRVIEVKEDSYITKGDANHSQDQNPVMQEQVIGKYIGSIPYLGYILFYCKKYLWVLIIFILWRKKDEFQQKTNKRSLHTSSSSNDF